MERRHWWNGRQGRLAKEDLYLIADDGVWRVEWKHRDELRQIAYDREQIAWRLLQQFFADGQPWREVTSDTR